MFPLPIGSIIKIVGAVIIVLTLVITARWIIDLKADLAVSQANAEKLSSAITQQQSVIEQLQQEQEQIRQLTKSVNDQIVKQNRDVIALIDRFNTNARGEPRNWGRLAAEKPAQVERAINRGSMNALRCLEIASGSPLTEAEKNATKPEEINRECPSLANPSFKPVK